MAFIREPFESAPGAPQPRNRPSPNEVMMCGLPQAQNRPAQDSQASDRRRSPETPAASPHQARIDIPDP